jgi:hypothetical protein
LLFAKNAFFLQFLQALLLRNSRLLLSQASLLL